MCRLNSTITNYKASTKHTNTTQNTQIQHKNSTNTKNKALNKIIIIIIIMSLRKRDFSLLQNVQTGSGAHPNSNG